MAVHAGDVLHRAQCVASLPEALTGCQRAIATTTRERSALTALEPPWQALPWLFEPASSSDNTPPPAALIFGPEYRGLSNPELNYAQRFLRIPSSPDYPSLNLAQAVAICCYELYQLSQQNRPNPSLATRPIPANPVRAEGDEAAASLELLEGYYQQLEALLLKIGYLYPHTAASRMEKFRRFFNRAAPSEGELAMLRGILRQMDWALSQESNASSIR